MCRALSTTLDATHDSTLNIATRHMTNERKNADLSLCRRSRIYREMPRKYRIVVSCVASHCHVLNCVLYRVVACCIEYRVECRATAANIQCGTVEYRNK